MQLSTFLTNAVIVAALVTLVGVVLRVLFASFDTTRSKYLDTVTVHRIRWIEEVRGDFAEWMHQITQLRELLHAEDKGDDFKGAMFVGYRKMIDIALKLDLEKTVHRDAFKLLILALGACSQNDAERLQRLNSALTRRVRDILKEEWETVKIESAGPFRKALLLWKRRRRKLRAADRFDRSVLEPSGELEKKFLVRLSANFQVD